MKDLQNISESEVRVEAQPCLRFEKLLRGGRFPDGLTKDELDFMISHPNTYSNPGTCKLGIHSCEEFAPEAIALIRILERK